MEKDTLKQLHPRVTVAVHKSMPAVGISLDSLWLIDKAPLGAAATLRDYGLWISPSLWSRCRGRSSLQCQILGSGSKESGVGIAMEKPLNCWNPEFELHAVEITAAAVPCC